MHRSGLTLKVVGVLQPSLISKKFWSRTARPSLLSKTGLVTETTPDTGREDIRIGVHDASRIEWIATIPLDRTPFEYEMEFTAEIPSNLLTPHDVWGQLQELARLHSPAEDTWEGAESDLDDVRRSALTVAHQLKILRDRYERCCMMANSLILLEPMRNVQVDLLAIHLEACGIVNISRGKLREMVQISPSCSAERRLADEFLSTKLIDFLSQAEKAVDDVLLGERSRYAAQYQPQGERLRDEIGRELAEELGHRLSQGYINPTGESPEELELYLERTSDLKKHFQEVLFLDMDVQRVEHRLRNWVAAMAAILASIFYFVALLTTMNGSQISVVTTAFIGALVYAVKDRIKEVTRNWLASRITKHFGVRTTTLRVPGKLMKDRPILVDSRDTFSIDYEARNDELNPELGTTRRVAILRFTKKGTVRLNRAEVWELQKKGLRSIKQIFRYDLSPLFARLDDPVKRIPVLDGTGKRVRFVDAPRSYRFPVCVKLRTAEASARQSGDVVAQKEGIVRFDAVR